MMDKSNIVSSYFKRASQIKDQLLAIGDHVEEKELVLITLNGFLSSWDVFVQGICARKKIPKFDKLWIYCTQEEARLISKMQKMNDEENQALASHVNKGKGKKVTKNTDRRPKLENKNDMSKIRNYNYNKLGHYARNCTQENKRGKRKHHAHMVDHDEPTSYKKSKGTSNKNFYFKVLSLKGVVFG